jgi:NSS family neurotransmitter:Na+ symporter
MATPQSLIHGSARPREVFSALALTGLVFLHVWELPQLAAAHGGFSFVVAWLLCFALLGLPLVLMQLMLGRRSRRSPIEGMAFLTREADAPRFWRGAAWGSALASLLALAVIALLAGGSINFLARELQLVDGTVQTVTASGMVWPLGTGTLFLLAAGLNLLQPAQRSLLVLIGLVLVLALLLLAAVAGSSTAASLYQPGRLVLTDWREALRLALYSVGGGAGVVWIGGMQMARESSLARLGLATVLLHAVLAVLLLFALAPFVAAAQANAHGETLQIVPTGAVVWVLMLALVLASTLVLALVSEPLLFWLSEKKLARLPSALLVFVPAAAVAEAVWFFGGAVGVQQLLACLGLLLLLVLLGLALFAGWVMKISQVRKELALPNEGLYNLWRVAVRIALPLSVLWVLSGYFL